MDAPVLDNVSLYTGTRERIVELVRHLGPDEAARPVPGTPAWTVKDLVAHLAGHVACVLAGDMEGMATEEWTAKHVAERAGRSLPEVLSEWEGNAAAFEEFLAADTMMLGRMVIVDTVTHEHDLRGALGRPGATDEAAFDVALQAYVQAVDRRLRGATAPGLRLRAGNQEWILGDGEPAATLSTTPLALFRSLGGRRSRAQVRALGWDGDAEPYLDLLSPFGPLGESDVVEAGPLPDA